MTKKIISNSQNGQRDHTPICWICGSSGLDLTKTSDISGALTPDAFAITDSDYGKTTELYKCTSCGFIQSSEASDVLSYYKELKDAEYEAGRKERGIQANKLLNTITGSKPYGRLVDIGAGSGILVEEAIKLGYKAEGVEPSIWLQNRAAERNIPVHLGVFPHPDVAGNIDVISIVDVIEHVNDPVGLLTDIRKGLSDSGIGLVVTPDVGSFAAHLLGKRWWHYRIAHIGYFNRKTLFLALERAGLDVVCAGRPCWYFTLSYLLERANHYLPSFLRLPDVAILSRMTIPLNLRDSLYVVFRKIREESTL